MSRKTPVYLDTEFILSKYGPMPLSLAFSTEDHGELYVVITDTDRSLADEFVQSEVLPYIDNEVPGATNYALPSHVAKHRILEWLQSIRSLHGIEFWAYFCAHDWVTLVNLWGGRFTDLPRTLPHKCNDVMTIADWKGYRLPELPRYEGSDEFPTHHAMTDARDVKLKHQFLVGNSKVHY